MTDPTPWDDTLYGFHLAGGLVRGRLVRLGAALDEVLRPHDHPPVVQGLLAETTLLAAALAGGLKYDGVFTLQTSGDGPVRTLMADVTSTGDLRAVARVDRDRLDSLETGHPAVGRADPAALLGRGHLAFTVDQGPYTDRYQGITALVGGTLSAAVEHYFDQSEQLATVVQTATHGPGHGAADGEPETATASGGWRGGCLLLQRMPAEAGGRSGAAADDAWETAGVLARTLTGMELLDPALSPDRIVHRLFHGEAPMAGETRALRFGCRCSRDKIEAVLSRYPRGELDTMKQDDGIVSAACQFCGAHYTFSDDDLDVLAGPRGDSEPPRPA